MTTENTDLATWLLAQEELALLMAHDLRNPLAAILANLSFLDLSVAHGDQDSREAIADVKLSADVLLRLIENYASMARLESPRGQSFQHADASLCAAARNAVERAQSSARSAGVTLSVRLPREDLHVRADRALLELLIDNLVSNAVQHVRRERTAELSVEPCGDRVLLVLTDEGCAFGPIERDFSRNGQLEIKKVPDGRYSRGLALYVIGLISRALGATIEATLVGGRSRITLSFPGSAP